MAYSSLKSTFAGSHTRSAPAGRQVYISRLSQQLGATPVTIRNDLSVLERDGRLQRVPGGAVPLARAAEAQTVGEVRAAEKRAIAARVAEMVHDGDRLMLNSGTTTLAVAEALKVRRGCTSSPTPSPWRSCWARSRPSACCCLAAPSTFPTASSPAATRRSSLAATRRTGRCWP